MIPLALLGSTGSIGRSTLQVVREMGGVEVTGLAAGNNVELLLEQALEFRPKVVSLADEPARDRFATGLRSAATDSYRPELEFGPPGNLAVATQSGSQVLVSAAVGVAGLAATHAAVSQGQRIALANKEVLVAAGELVMAEASRSGAEVLPVDSEHNAAHQCLRCGRRDEVIRLILTASGGPFRQTPKQEMEALSPEQALQHPTWKMGPRITIDSATLMNKGFEVIEACHLFGFGPDAVAVVVHPQSVVHAMVEYQDGSVVAQLAPPDMKLPIRYALSYPDRQPGLDERRLRWDGMLKLEFEPPDWGRFPLLRMAYDVIRKGGLAGCVLNAADEIAVESFLASRIPFTAIPGVIESTLSAVRAEDVASIDAVLDTDRLAREHAASRVERYAARAVF